MITIDPPIEKLTRLEKFALIAELETSLLHDEEEFEIPEWHLDLLRQRQAAAERGEDPTIPFEEAFAQLRAERSQTP